MGMKQELTISCQINTQLTLADVADPIEANEWLKTHIDAVKIVAKILFFWNKSKLLIVVVNVVGWNYEEKNKKISIYRTRIWPKVSKGKLMEAN